MRSPNRYQTYGHDVTTKLTTSPSKEKRSHRRERKETFSTPSNTKIPYRSRAFVGWGQKSRKGEPGKRRNDQRPRGKKEKVTPQKGKGKNV